MSRITIAALVLSAVSAFAAQQNPTFRSGTDLLMLDVSVLDKSRQPVSGLTAGDFTVTVDGQPRPVVAFKFIDVPAPLPVAPSAAPWVREVGPDVTTNAHVTGRVVAIVIDDYSLIAASVDQAGVMKARETALAVLDTLGPQDRAAVVLTSYAHNNQTFTSNRELLRTAIMNAPMFPGPAGTEKGEDIENPACFCGACNIETLGRVSTVLRSLVEQRKILVYISAGSVVPSQAPPLAGSQANDVCLVRRRDAMHDALRLAQAANVTIEAFSPKLLSVDYDFNVTPNGPLEKPSRQRPLFLQTMAESTGGRAILNSNDPDLQVPAVMAESRSYYLLGVEPVAPGTEGEQHSIRVRVNRPDVDVRTRSGYYDLTEKDRERPAASLAMGPLTPVISGPMSTAGIPLTVAAAPFATVDGQPAVAITLSVGQPDDAPPQVMPRTETVDMVASLFHPETADNLGWAQQRQTLTWTALDRRFGSFELLSRVSAPPGRYELRVAAKTADGNTSSVYASVDIPDFESPLSLSGLVLSATPSPVAAPPDGLSDLLPVVPTGRRTFQKADGVKAFLRVYQRARSFAPATMATTITSATGEIVARDDKRIPGAPFATGSTADYQVDVPVSQLPAGDYLLTVRADVGNRNAQRHVRFSVE